MRNKKLLGLLLLIFISLFTLSACNNESEELVLRIYNWQDYIDDGTDDNGEKVSSSVIDEWATWYEETYGEKVTYVYDTFETNEVMLNNMKTGKNVYDIVCPSEYAIQKMLNLDMIQRFDLDLKDKNGNLILSNYKYISTYLVDLFAEKGWDEYAIPYMWGTVGFIYNAEAVSEEEASSWNLLWNPNIKSTAKDSIRDTFVAGVMYVYQDELKELEKKMNNGIISQAEYTKIVGEIMNRCDDETLEKVQTALIEMKNSVYGFEVDSGKNDIVTGKIDANLAWSGDAVYSMDVAEEEEGVILNYAVPKEGSNVWFDGWVMPKGANVELAQSFINYLCSPEIAVRNMEKIGYTSAIVGDEVMDMIVDWYGAEEESEGYPVDLTYLFTNSLSDSYYTIDEETQEKRAIVYVEERGRQFDAQYPDEETIMRCGIMEDFGDRNDAVIAMWENVKIGDISIWITIVLVAVIIMILTLMYGKKAYTKYQRKLRKQKYSKN